MESAAIVPICECRTSAGLWFADSCRVSLGGDMCTHSMVVAGGRLRRWVERSVAPSVLVDLDAVRFVDGRGVRLLVELYGNSGDRRLRFVRPSPAVCKVFDLCDLMSLLPAGASCAQRREERPSLSSSGGSTGGRPLPDQRS